MRKLKLLALRLWVWIHIRNHPEQLLKLSPEGAIPEHFRAQNILVFSNTAMGDTLLSTPAMFNLRQCFPEARICLFIHKNMRPMFEGLPFIDHMINFHGSYHHFRETIDKLRHFNPDIALLLHSNAPQDIPMAILAGARIILKPETKSQFRNYLSLQMDNTGQHIIQERNRLVAALGCKPTHIRMHLPDRYRNKDRGNRIRIGFQLGAADGYKMWPTEKFAALATLLIQENDQIDIILTGSHGERNLCSILESEIGSQRIKNECGRWDIRDLPNLLASLDLLITNDTGTLHVAIALGIPTLSLFSPTPSLVFGPLQDLTIHKVIEKPPFKSDMPKKQRGTEEISQITPAEVFQVALDMINRTF
jgi:ADP-heptose:LPS heptosyltransferase